MADVDPAMKCTTCSHKASSHGDNADGENTGAACGLANCDCSAMSTGVGDSDGDAAAAAAAFKVALIEPLTAEGAFSTVADGIQCVRTGCPHMSEQHKDLDDAPNAGKCLAEGCACGQMMTPGSPGEPAPADKTSGETDATLAAETDDMGGDGGGGVDDDSADPPGIPFRALLIQEGIETSDDRMIEANALTWRKPPLPLMCQFRSDHGGMGDTSAVIIGRIDNIERLPNGADGVFDIWATGDLDGEGENGLEAARMIDGKFLLGVSADLAISAADIEITAVDDDGWPIGERLIVTSGELGMATVTPFPAFGDCQITLLSPENLPESPDEIEWDLPEVGDRIPVIAAGDDPYVAHLALARLPDCTGPVQVPSFTYSFDEGCAPCAQRATAAGLTAAGGPIAPPAAWFDDPELDPELTTGTPLTIDDDGRVYGHLAVFGQCHMGIANACVTPPKEPDYTYFETGVIRTAEGTDIPVGQLTVAGGHADTRLGARAAMQHYDDTDSVYADVCAGVDDIGIWVAGALRTGLSDEMLRAAKAAPLSGDWRWLGGKHRLVAACSVNVPGYLVPRVKAHVASGVTLAIVAAGAVAQTPVVEAPEPITASLLTEVRDELAQLRREREADRLLARIGVE